MSAPRIHQVSCSIFSEDDPSDDFDRCNTLAERLAAYARKLGFGVMHENVDYAEPSDLPDSLR